MIDISKYAFRKYFYVHTHIHKNIYQSDIILLLYMLFYNLLLKLIVYHKHFFHVNVFLVLIFFSNWTFYLEIIIDSHSGIIRNNIETSCVPFTQFLPLLTSCRTVVQYHNPDVQLRIQSRGRTLFCHKGSSWWFLS